MLNELTTALDNHRRGQLDQAALGYQSVLAAHPDHPDALHLLGVLAHQFGNHVRAADLISRAIALRPASASYHANLAEVYRAQGKLDQASQCCQAALQIQPNNAAAANSLGLVFLSRNLAADAAKQFRAAIHFQTDFALAHNNLGNALRLLGDKDQALLNFRRAVQIDPHLSEARSNLGQFLLERKQLAEALIHCREAVRLRPDFAPAHSNLGNVLREMHRLEEARACYTEALRLDPNVGMIHNNMAQALQEEGKLDEAFQWYQQAIERDPRSARIRTNLASLLTEQEKENEALSCFELALRLDPGYAEALNGFGFIHHEQGNYDQAQNLYQQALRLNPELTAAYCNLGTVREELSDFAGAEACFREALRHDQRLPGARSQLATMLRKELPQADLEAMRQLLADPHFSDAQRGCLHYGLAQVLDARGDYTAAAEHLVHANRITVAERTRRGQSYDPGQHERFVDQLIATFTPQWFEKFRGLGSDSQRPIFIVGLPRSGTTLTEQVLASHPCVFGAGELHFARDDFKILTPGSDSAPLLHFDAQRMASVAESHLARLTKLNADKPYVVDKMPENYLYLGLLAVLFPRAKFIHCRRDLRDVAVSCWMTNFRHLRWASDLDHIADRFAAYERLTDHWRRVLPTSVLEVEYEDTVVNLEGVARQLLEFCGLEWDPACLAFHEGKRPVRTASVSQVRQPVYNRSVARWKNYEASMGSLFARLESLVLAPFAFPGSLPTQKPIHCKASTKVRP